MSERRCLSVGDFAFSLLVQKAVLADIHAQHGMLGVQYSNSACKGKEQLPAFSAVHRGLQAAPRNLDRRLSRTSAHVTFHTNL
eukprot:980889-Pelagomonas_calceolata.AAC.1